MKEPDGGFLRHYADDEIDGVEEVSGTPPESTPRVASSAAFFSESLNRDYAGPGEILGTIFSTFAVGMEKVKAGQLTEKEMLDELEGAFGRFLKYLSPKDFKSVEEKLEEVKSLMAKIDAS